MTEIAATSVVPIENPSAARLLPSRFLAWRWTWCLLAVLVCLHPLALSGLAPLRDVLADTDDVMRLIQVRTWLDGAGWFDLRLPRLGGSEPLLSHWSRLLDVPLALLLLAFEGFMSPPAAELTVRVLWPSLVLLVFLRLLVHEAEVRGGAWAGVFLLVLAVTCATGLYQFRPGRLDHHNVMIAGTVGGLLLLVRGLDAPRRALAGGALLGGALAIGYEPLALIVPVLALLALAAALHAPWLASAGHAFAGLAAVLLAAFLTTVPPARWFVVGCDALALNLVVMAVLAAAGIAGIARLAQGRAMSVRLAAMLGVGVASLALAWGMEPGCARGPFGQVSATTMQLWLAHVDEGKTLWAMHGANAVWVWSVIALMIVGVWAATSRWREQRTVESAALLVIMLWSVVPAALMGKFHPYVCWLAVFCLAVRIAGLNPASRVSVPLARAALLVALSPSTLSGLAGLAVATRAVKSSTVAASEQSCHLTAHYGALATLPPGLVVSSINLGPFIISTTAHSAFVGPYHRMDRQIVETFAIFHALPDDAEHRLRTVGARYLVYCPGTMAFGSKGMAQQSLLAALDRGEVPGFLRRIATPATPLQVYTLRTP